VLSADWREIEGWERVFYDWIRF